MFTPVDTLDASQLLQALPNMDLPALLAARRLHGQGRWEHDLQISRALAEHLLKRGAPIQALDLARDELGRHPADVRLQQLEGLALARIGAIQEANRVLRKLFDGGHLDPETMGALARTYKDMWEQEADPVKARGCLDQAHELYHDVYDLTCRQKEEDPDSALYTGINAASTALLRGEGEEARRLALAVRTWCERRLARSSDYWAEATLGEVALILGDHPGAEQAYARAASKWRGNVGDQSRTRHQARVLLAHLGQDPHALDHCFTIGRVAVFAGHMVDQPNRAVPRFPPGLVPQVREAIRARLAELDIRVGFSSAACGADLLFLEALLGREGEAHVVLPCPLEHFRRDSVDIIPDALWGERLTDVLRRAAHVEVASEQLATPGPATYDFANILLLGLAIMRARQLDTELVPLAVWNGQSGDGPGGTAAVVERWQSQGLHPIIIDLAEMLRTKARLPSAGQSAAVAQIRPRGPSPTAAPHEIKALLFADVAHFSRLTDDQLVLFVRHFLAAIAGLVAQATLADPPYAPLMKNTWGDGLHFVFSGPQEAGQFALQLCDLIKRTDWGTKGLPKDLNIRIALHAGPVHEYTNPITGFHDYIGTHVSRAARIEPITPPGYVYASEPFAALAAAQRATGFVCEYVRQAALAKDYGTFPTYHVRRQG